MSNFYIVTGASRGFGRALTELLPLNAGKNEIVVMGRNLEKLDQTKQEIHGKWNKVSSIALDFNQLDMLDSEVDKLVNSIPSSTNHVYFFNNAGSLGPLKRVQDLDLVGIKESMDGNLTGGLYFTSQLVKHISFPMTIINTSSLAAVQPFDTWSIYCSTKAARDMFHKCIVLEATEQQKPIKVLNYAPGPLDTDMQKEIRELMPPVKLRTQFEKMHTRGKLVSPKASAEKLLEILRQDKYKSGDHVDYFD